MSCCQDASHPAAEEKRLPPHLARVNRYLAARCLSSRLCWQCSRLVKRRSGQGNRRASAAKFFTQTLRSRVDGAVGEDPRHFQGARFHSRSSVDFRHASSASSPTRTRTWGMAINGHRWVLRLSEITEGEWPSVAVGPARSSSPGWTLESIEPVSRCLLPAPMKSAEHREGWLSNRAVGSGCLK